MKYYLIAGEPSGDLHGSKLIAGLRKADPQAEFRFWGGDLMATEGGKEGLAKHYRETSFFGFMTVLRNLRTIGRQFEECRADIEHFAPDVLILIDYPGFNMKMAKWAKERGLRTFYYIAPKVWAWKEWRVKKLRRYVDRLFTIFPFESEYFRAKGIEPTFCGNPLVDDIEARRATFCSREEFIRRNNLDNRPIIALLAGSRVSEIRENLPAMVELSKRMPDYQFVVTAVPWIDKHFYWAYMADGKRASDVRYVCDQTQQTLSVAEAAVVTSGTATLETALMRIPEMVVYHVPKLYEVLRPYVLKIPFVSLVNINLGREAVRELVCAKLDLAEAERELRAIVSGGEKREKMLADFDQLGELIGGAGASERFAAEMVRLIQDSKLRIQN
ncbi:MAG: lipid-A-disaccharide synthase [Rikenellaceae bacterium]|nr:lipid-A-disaccharide synthase [Rikenellaceae bacterium]